MKNTAPAPIPVRLRLLPGGTAPVAVANLIDALTPLVTAEMTDTEKRDADRLTRKLNPDVSPRMIAPALAGRGAASAAEATFSNTNDAGELAAQAAADVAAAQNRTPQLGGAAAALAGSLLSRAEWEAQQAGESPAQQTPPPAPTALDEAASKSGKTREIIVPIEPGADPEEARRILISRLNGPMPSRTSLIMQTSGSTTANGHLVSLSMPAIVASARSTLAHLGTPGRWILALPVNHIAGLQVLVRSILSGSRPVIVDTTKGFKLPALVRAINRATDHPEVPAYLSLVPTQLAQIVDESGEALQALTKVKAVLLGGASTTPYLLKRAREAGVNIVTTYGMTETCGGCVYDGLPLAGVQVAAVSGQIWLSGTVLMEGYLEVPLPGEESPFIEMGARRWMRTRDTGRMDGPRLVVQGRSDDVINTGGVKVHASAVENAASEVRGVGEVAVVGLPDPRWGEVVTAVVVPATDVEEDDILDPLSSLGAGGLAEPDSLAARIRTTVAAEIGSTHAPRIIVVVPFLPKMGPSKIDRREVVAMARRELRAGRAWVR